MSLDNDDPWRLRAALDGDAEAWEFLVDQFHVQIWRWARNCGLDRDDSLDVAQTVWLRLKDKGGGITDPRRLPGWLATTTKRLAIETKKRRTRTMPVDLPEAERADEIALFSQEPPSPDHHSIASDVRERLTSAYQELSDPCRDLLALSWHHHSYEDISATLDIPKGSIGPSRGRCLAELRLRAGIDKG